MGENDVAVSDEDLKSVDALDSKLCCQIWRPYVILWFPITCSNTLTSSENLGHGISYLFSIPIAHLLVSTADDSRQGVWFLMGYCRSLAVRTLLCTPVPSVSSSHSHIGNVASPRSGLPLSAHPGQGWKPTSINDETFPQKNFKQMLVVSQKSPSFHKTKAVTKHPTKVLWLNFPS